MLKHGYNGKSVFRNGFGRLTITMTQPYVALKVLMMPKDANHLPTASTDHSPSVHYGTIFGGVILSHIDIAGAIAARREIQLRGGNPKLDFVTVAINRVEFKQPVLVGDVVSYETTLVKIGRTSVTIAIHVVAERGATLISVTDAEAVYVAIDPTATERRPVPVLPTP
jgi:acyl-CoA thioesterase YciA